MRRFMHRTSWLPHPPLQAHRPAALGSAEIFPSEAGVEFAPGARNRRAERSSILLRKSVPAETLASFRDLSPPKANPEVESGRVPQFIALDFETANRRPTSACAVGLVRIDRGVVVDRQYHLIRPPHGSWVFSDLHGISDLDTRGQPTFIELWPSIARFLSAGEFVAAHNAGFDAGVLRACCVRAGLRPPRLRFICSLGLARAVLSIHPANLANVCHRLGIELEHHNALSDAEAAARVVLAAASRGWRWNSW